MLRKQYLLFIGFLFICSIFCLNQTNFAQVSSNTEFSSLSPLSYQNDTIQYPSWSNGIYFHTYDQYGQLQILPFQTDGSWISPIYSENTFYFYNWETIVEISGVSSIDLTIYTNYEGGGWTPMVVPLNYTLNALFPDNWEFYFQFNLSKGGGELSSIIFNFTFFYLRDIPEIIDSFTLVNPIFELALVLIILISLIFVYVKVKSVSLMTIVFLFFLIVSVYSLFDVTIPFYPFIQVFLISFGTYLFIDLITKYRNQNN